MLSLLVVSSALLFGLDDSTGLDVQDVWGRSLHQAGITLVDWEGHIGNPAFKLILHAPADAAFPATFQLAADGPRLYFDDLGNLSNTGPKGPTKTVNAKSKDAKPNVYLAIFPDRDGKDESYTLNIRCIDANKVEGKCQLPIHVNDQDRNQPPAFKIIIDHTEDKTGFFENAKAREIVRQAADDWAYYFSDMQLDSVPADSEQTHIWSPQGFVDSRVVRNRAGYTGYLMYVYGIKGPGVRSGGEGSYDGGYQVSKGKKLPLRRSGGVEVEIQGNYNRRGWSYTTGDDDWAKTSNYGHEQNDLYSIVHHEMGHALAFNGAYPRFAAFRLFGMLNDPALKAYLGSVPKPDRSDHLHGVIDKASRRGAFGYEYYGDMPKRRWLITKTDLLAAQAVGYELRKTSPFEPLTAKIAGMATGKVGRRLELKPVIKGGVPPYYCSIASGKLPDGLVLDSFNGAMAGTPRAAGRHEFALLVRDEPETKGVTIPIELVVAESDRD